MGKLRCSNGDLGQGPQWAENDGTRRVSPPSPFGETQFLSERDLIVAVDQLGVFVLILHRNSITDGTVPQKGAVYWY